MASIKTAVSLQEPLFEQVEALAREMNISRSHLFALAIEEFIRRRENQKLAEQIDAAYGNGLDEEDQALLRGMRRQHRRLVEGEW